jgi:ArsR family transcriptional regulator
MSDLCKEIAQMGKGIGNENRYRILESVMNGSKTVSEIAEIVRLPQPAVSQNLKVLKSANLVSDERRGKEVFYSVNVAYMAKLLKKLAHDVSGKAAK